MTAITSAGTGFWDVGGTWVGGVAPGNGDTVLITSTHVVTVRNATTVGHSPPSNDATAAVDVGATARLVIDSVQLTCRGDMRLIGNGTVRDALTIQGTGGILEFDASQATTPASQKYRMLLGTGNFQYPRMKLVGASRTDRVIMRSNAGGGAAFITVNGNTAVTLLDASFAKFVNMFDGSNVFFAYSLGSQTQMEMKLADVIFDGCGALNSSTTPNTTADLTLDRVLWKNTVGSSCCSFPAGPATNKAFFRNCHPDKTVQWTDTANWTIDDNLFQVVYTLGGSTAWDSFQRNFVRKATSVSSPTQVNGPVRRLYFLWESGTNPHGVSFRSPGIAGDLDEVIFDPHQTSSAVGDFVNTGAGTSPRAVTVKRTISLRNSAGGQGGKLVSTLGSGNRFTVEHNTAISNGAGSQSECGILEYGESGNGADGDFLSVKSNLAIGNAANSAVIVSRDIASTTQIGTTSTAAMFDYNATYQGRGSSTDALGYHAYHVGATKIFSTGTPGTHDVVLASDPCVDSTRNMATWDTALGGAGTAANAITELRKRFDEVTWNSAYTVANLYAYIEAGFEVTAVSLNNAGHDGVTIGARPYSPPPSNRRPAEGLNAGFSPFAGGLAA